jgi:pilus assembly protein Flp/PilA
MNPKFEFTMMVNEEVSMQSLKQLPRSILLDESGQDLIEYALVAALVGVGAIGAMTSLTSLLGNTFNAIGNSLGNAAA